MVKWQSYTAIHNQHTVVGELLITENVHSPQLENDRHILIWLPPSYHQSDERYPVLYMHDGDNLFDAHTSFSGEWGVDETLTLLSNEGLEAIVVGIPNMGAQRFSEYNPFHWRVQGKGELYIRFIIETLKPIVDTDFRTDPSAATTGLVGSSMGGLISLYGFLQYPQVFGLCGAFSPVFWFSAGALDKMVYERAHGNGRIYIDIGTKEGEVYTKYAERKYSRKAANNYYRDGVRQLYKALLEKGYTDDSVLYVEDDGAHHNEAAWAKRLPDALRFLLKAKA